MESRQRYLSLSETALAYSSFRLSLDAHTGQWKRIMSAELVCGVVKACNLRNSSFPPFPSLCAAAVMAVWAHPPPWRSSLRPVRYLAASLTTVFILFSAATFFLASSYESQNRSVNYLSVDTVDDLYGSVQQYRKHRNLIIHIDNPKSIIPLQNMSRFAINRFCCTLFAQIRK